MPLFGSRGPDRLLVNKLTYCLGEVVATPIKTDDRVPGYLMPLNTRLKPKVFIERWSKTDTADVYEAFVVRGERPPREGEPWRFVQPAIPLGMVWLAWPGAPDENAVANKVAEWLLILDGRQKADFEVKRGPVLAGVPTVHFNTRHNGYSAGTMGLIYDPI